MLGVTFEEKAVPVKEKKAKKKSKEKKVICMSICVCVCAAVHFSTHDKMLISLHKQATTTPKIRAAIQASGEPAWIVAERYGISEQTVWKWRKRESVYDRSHTAHRLQTTLTPAQEAVAVALRRTLMVSLDDLLAVVREFLNPDASRSGLDRCLRR
jgi:transposase-like protein